MAHTSGAFFATGDGLPGLEPEDVPAQPFANKSVSRTNYIMSIHSCSHNSYTDNNSHSAS